MRLLIILAVVSCLALHAGCDNPARDNASEQRATAQRLLKEQRQEQRAEMQRLGELIRAHPKDPALYVQRGFAWIERDDVFQADDQFDRALRIDRAHLGALCGKGFVAAESDSDLRPLSDLAENRGRDYAPAHYWLGRALNSIGDYDDAIEAYGKAIELNPTYAEAYHTRGMAAVDKRLEDSEGIEDSEYSSDSDDSDGMLADFRQAIFFDPGLADAYTRCGDILMNRDEPQRALRNYARAISLQPADPYPYSRRGRAMSILEEYHDAADDFQLAQELADRTDRWDIVQAMNFDRGVALFHVGDYDGAEDALSDAIDVDSNNADAWCYHADCMMKTWRRWESEDDYSEAIRLYEQAERSGDPKYDASMHARALYGRARSRDEMSNSRAAERDRRAANRVDPDYEDVGG